MLRNCFRTALFLTLLTTVFSICGCNRPSFNSAVTPEQEKTIGDWAAAQIQSESPGPVDPAVTAEVSRITTRLNAEDPSRVPIRILISDSDTYSLSSLPGNWIVISSKMVTLFQDQPDALAGLIAHEYGHVFNDDSMKEMTDALGSDSLLNMTTQGKYTDTSNVAVQLMNFAHNADSEERADNAGVRIAALAGYDPHGIVMAINVLMTITPSTDAQWLMVHPVTKKRLDALTTYIALYSPEPKNK